MCFSAGTTNTAAKVQHGNTHEALPAIAGEKENILS
jgi:hypothetical protein